MKRQGWDGKMPAASILTTIEDGRIKGTQWALRGNLEKIWVPVRRLRKTDHNLKYQINLQDLSRFKFPTLTNPQEGGESLGMGRWPGSLCGDISQR